MTSKLFECAPLVDWLPGETLFSLVSRLHRLSGRPHSWQTAEILFGGRHAGTHHDFPSALDQFAARTDQRLGIAEVLAREHTLLRYYRPFLVSEKALDAVAAMQGNSVAHLKFRLGLLTSRFRANHPLKACSACMRADLADHGWTYWHLDHQYPGVWVCPRHGGALAESTVKSTGVGRFLWHLPDPGTLTMTWALKSEASLESLTSLGSLTTGLVERDESDGWIGMARVQAVLRVRLASRGWITAGGNLKLREVSADFLRYCEKTRGPTELDTLPQTEHDAATQIGRLLRPLDGGTHPLRLVLAMNWLFDGFSEFLREFDLVGKPDPDHRLDEARCAPSDAHSRPNPRRRRVMELVRGGASLTSAAAQVGVDVATAMTWASQAGLVVGRRPKTLIAAVRTALIEDLRTGVEKRLAAQRYGISVGTVTRVLLAEPGLHQAWQEVRCTKARTTARQAWLDLLATYGGMGTKLIRSMNPAAYAWLYRNDRVWLKQNSASKASERNSVSNSGTRWDVRDQRLSAAVEVAALDLQSAFPLKPLRLWQLYQAVPALKPRLAVLDRLPLTRRAIELAVSRRPRPEHQSDLLEP